MHGFIATYLRELLIMRHRFWRIIMSFSVSPLLYLIAFGLGMGHHMKVGGVSYVEFLIPGLVAMTSMTQGFGINVEINVARFYLKVFEEFQAAPITNFSYVCGEVAAGVTRALLSASVIVIIAIVAGLKLHFNFGFWFIAALNATFFAALGVTSAMLIKNHADQSLITNLIITPMAFLGGTFFPIKNLPEWARVPLELIPLSHASKAIRQLALGGAFSWNDAILLFGLAIFAILLAWWSVDKARD